MYEPIAEPARRVAQMTDYRRAAEAAARDFDAAVASAPTRPAFPRVRRKSAPLTVFLIGCVAGIVIAWGWAAFASHVGARVAADLAVAAERVRW